MTERRDRDGQSRLEAVLEDLLRRRRSGEAVDLDELSRRHPEHSEAIRELVARLEESVETTGGADSFALVGSIDDRTRTEQLGDEPAEASPDDELAPGDRLGPYRIDARLGEGGFGIVYAAERVEGPRLSVAIKVPKREHLTREFLARFEVESQALARMEHPAIARVHDAGHTPDGRPYYVMLTGQSRHTSFRS